MTRSRLLLVPALVVGCVGAPPPAPSQGTGSSSESSTGSGTSEPSPGTQTQTGSTSTTAADEDSSTTSPPPDNGSCTHECSVQEDCILHDGSAWDCVDARCVDPNFTPCSTDGQCVVELSGWLDGALCKTNAECSRMLCVGAGGEGHCLPSADRSSCAAQGLDPIEVVDVEGAPAVVCGHADATCGEDGQCTLPCQGDDDCFAPQAPLCEIETGRCVCSDDAQCLSASAGDLCLGGACRCTDDAVCELGSPFEGGTASCLGLGD